MTRAYDFACKCWLVPAFWLLACARGRAPLPPDASIYPTDEAHDAFDMKLPRDATHVVVPAWASLEEAWGTYDPPFMNGFMGTKTGSFCVMDPRTGRKVVEIRAHDMRSGGST